MKKFSCRLHAPGVVGICGCPNYSNLDCPNRVEINEEHVKIHESTYGGTALNFHVVKHGAELHVDLTYPPSSDAENVDGQCRYIVVDQESVRASDGVRLHYDYDRDGFVVEQPRPRLVKTGKQSYEDLIDWTEVGFFPSWRFNDREDGSPSQEEYDCADGNRDST